jgi:5-methylcytosine-specific restriction endonuclease McrA
LAVHQLTVDHIRSRQRDGTNDIENLATACCACNGIKAEWDKRIYDPIAFGGKPAADVLDAAKKYIEDWYRLWDPGYQEMITQATQACL